MRLEWHNLTASSSLTKQTGKIGVLIHDYPDALDGILLVQTKNAIITDANVMYLYLPSDMAGQSVDLKSFASEILHQQT